MLLMVEKEIRGGICHFIYGYVKANNKYMKDYDKDKESSYLQYWDANDLYGWVMSQKFLIENFKWVKDISKFDESFVKSYNEESDKICFLEVDVQCPGTLHNLLNDFPCCLKE